MIRLWTGLVVVVAILRKICCWRGSDDKIRKKLSITLARKSYIDRIG